ncbi:MAG: hypothetical protein NUV77_02025 [Thermoguttaceae bacterium]|jgi:hypothetical protein|nr:hypothetical protein [Thermoguttaceae bacterium]
MTRPGFEEVVRALAREATCRGQKFLVMKNFERLPQENLGRDIDLLVLPRSESRWRDLLDRVGGQLGLTRRPARKYYHCEQQVLDGLVSGSLQIDLIGRLHWRGVDWMSTSDVASRAVLLRDEIWVPEPADACVLTFCQSYLHGGLVVERHVARLVAAAQEHGGRVAERLAPIFGLAIAEDIVRALQRRDIAHLRAQATRYRLAVLRRGFLRHPCRFAVTAFLGYWMEWCITEEQVQASRDAKAEQPQTELPSDHPMHSGARVL